MLFGGGEGELRAKMARCIMTDKFAVLGCISYKESASEVLQKGFGWPRYLAMSIRKQLLS